MKSELPRVHGVRLYACLLLRPHTVRKTTSGKIARAWNKRAFLQLRSNECPWVQDNAVVHEWINTAAASSAPVELYEAVSGAVATAEDSAEAGARSPPQSQFSAADRGNSADMSDSELGHAIVAIIERLIAATLTDVDWCVCEVVLPSC